MRNDLQPQRSTNLPHYLHLLINSIHQEQYGKDGTGMGNFVTTAIIYMFVAFGVVVGGAMLGGIGSILLLQPPSDQMIRIADHIKIWALVAAVGGTIDPIRVIESNFLDGQLSPAIKQILYFLIAFIGAHMGTTLIHWLCDGSAKSA